MSRHSDLRFTFEPLKGDALEVVSFKLEEGLSQPFKLTLELATHNAAIDFNRVLDLAGLFTLWRDETPVRHVHGEALASQCLTKKVRCFYFIFHYQDSHLLSQT